MTGGRSKRRKTTGGTAAAADVGSGPSETLPSTSPPSADGLSMAAPLVAPGVDLFAQARKALTERCPFDSDEAVPRFGTLPSVLAVNLHKKSDGRRKHGKVQEDTAGKAVGPGRPGFSVWEKTEEYFRPITLDDIDLLVTRLPPISCFYLPGLKNVLEEVVKEEAVLDESPLGEMDVGSSSVAVKEELESIEVAAARAMQIDFEVTCSTALQVEEPEVEDKKSLNWILGCKHRFLLTSGRPSKKRKLLGQDANLEQLLLLPRIEAASPLCDFCCSEESDVKSNRFLFCDSCKVSVHQKCYGVHEVPPGGWLCSWCKYLESLGRKGQRNADVVDASFRPCLLCPKASGALKPLAGSLECSEETKFVHLFCSLWTPGMYVEDVGVMEPVMNVENLQGTRRKLVCNLCKVKHGACVRCSHGTCRTSLHPVCARAAKHQMEIWGKFGHDNVELRVFCVKHSPVQTMDSIGNAEHTSRVSKDDMVGKLLPASVPIKRFPKIKITHKSKDNNMVRDGKVNFVSDEGAKNDTNFDKEHLVFNRRPEEGDVHSNRTEVVVAPDIGNVLRNTSDVITIFKKILDRRKISISDVALELGVSAASLESSMMGEGTSIPSELKSKIIQWFQTFVHVQPSTCHLKSRNGTIDRDTINLPEVTGPLLVKSQPSCSRRNNKHDSTGDNAFPSSGEAFLQDNNCNQLPSSGEVFLQDNSNQKLVTEFGGVPSNHMNETMTDTNGGACLGNIEDCHLKELDIAETTLGKATGFLDSNTYGELLYEDEDKPGVDLKEVSNCSHLVVENNQIIEDDITELKTESLESPDYDANLAGNINNQDIRPGSRSSIHPFILKKLSELEKKGNIEACYNDKLKTTDTKTVDVCLSDTGKLDQLAKVTNMQILDLSPTEEIEGELLYLQNCLLDRVTSVKHSCEELIYRMISHLPQEIDAFRRKRWDMVLVSQYVREVKEAKKRGRKERRHKEAQAILAAATAAAASASRNSVLRKDAVDGTSSSQQNPLKISTATRRATMHSPPVPRPKETIPRSSVTKVSSDKHSGDFKFPDFTKENVLICDVCWRIETIVNRIFVCSNCKVAVHLECYRRLKDPTGPWRCELCEDTSLQYTSPRNQQLGGNEKSYSKAKCSLCGDVTGAFRKSTEGEWVHAFCAEWLLESTYKRGQQNLVGGMDVISKEKDSNTCCICHYRLGLCLKCSYGHCQAKFHPTCARRSGLFMNIKSIGGRFQHKAYCEKHSVEQREKADSQHGAEELKNIKQVRVDLEKVRLLCERVIRREKLKRELVVCSHGIFASRRDCVAFSAMVRSSFTPGISSESATTSIDFPSYSGTIQRSDDITVDSTTVYGRQSCRLPLVVDRKTDDSPTSQLSNRRKIADRIAFSGKQLPQRPIACVPNAADGGELRSKDRKFCRA